MTRKEEKEAAILTLVKENDELKTEIGRLRQALEQVSARKKGRWINQRKSVSTIGVYYCDCSECGYTLRDSWGVAKDFCPSCGTEMEHE